MATTDPAADQDWGKVAEVGEEEQVSAMLQRYGEVADLPEAERQSQMLAMVHAEYALADDKLRKFTLARMRTWLKLENETAKRVVATYDAVMLQMPGKQAMRRVTLAQTMAREFSPEDRERLYELAPRVFGGYFSGALTTSVTTTTSEETTTPTKRSWWPFKKR